MGKRPVLRARVQSTTVRRRCRSWHVVALTTRPFDQSVNFHELAMENLNECGEERATASLRRQKKLFIERAAHGEL